MLTWLKGAGLLILPAMVLLAVACTARPTPAQQEVTARLEELSSRVGQLEERTSTLHDTLRGLEERVVGLEQSTATLKFDPSLVGMSRAEFLPDPPPGMVTVQILAEMEGAALPGRFTFHLAPEGARLFETISAPEGEPVEIGQEIPNGIAFVEPGKFYRLQVVYRNPEDREVRFLVRGGLIDPRAALPFVRNRCWCAAVPFSAPPRGTFSRIIDVGVGPDTPPGAKAVVVFPVVPLE